VTVTHEEWLTDQYRGDELAHRGLVTVIVRLVLDRDGELSHGEIVDSSLVVRGRFSEWADLAPMLRRWLETERGSERPT
jgi:hypothetical protein